MKRTLFAAAEVLEILFWTLFVRQAVFYMEQNAPADTDDSVKP